MKLIISILAIVLMSVVFPFVRVFSQPANAIYATAQGSGGGPNGLAAGSYDVENLSNANYSGTSDNSYALLTASSTVLTYSAWVHLTFPNLITSSNGSPVTIYIRTTETASALLGGSLVLQGYNNTSGTGNSATTSALPYKTYFLADGTIFLAVTISSDFQSVRATLTSPIALGTNTMRIYYAFYGPSATNTSNPYPFNLTDCGIPNVTTKESSGLTLGNFSIKDPGNAIDTDPTFATKSSFITNGVSLLTGHVKQIFFFNGLSNSADAIRLVISKSGGLLAVNLLNGISMQAYNGSALVGNAQIAFNILDVSLLVPMGTSGTPVAIYFAPKDASNNSVLFDRVEVDLNIGVLGVAADNNALNIHDIRRLPSAPAAGNVTVCNNIGSITLSALSSQEGLLGSSGLAYRWYSSLIGGNSLFTGNNYNATGLTTPGSVSYYVNVAKTGCALESERKLVNVTVVQAPITPATALNP